MNPSAPSISTASLDPALARLVDDITAKLQRGERADLSAALRENPEFADELRGLLPALAALGDLSQSNEVDGLGLPTALDGTLGDFRLIREVGRGGMGVVYVAEQISLNRRVALKVLPFAATMDPRHLQRFRNEAQAAACLHHANIVPVFGVGCERGVHYYAMQLIEGQSLAQVISEIKQEEELNHRGTENTEKREKTIPKSSLCSLCLCGKKSSYFRHIAELVAQAADALEYAHSMGVVHRDIKPGNLMLDEGGHLWITDFGLAKLNSADAGITMTGDMIGTLRYMSPEQALAKHGLVDHRTDVYSLGATLYELLTVRPAVDGADKQEILKRIAFEEPMALRKIDKSIPAELETITLKSLAREPGERYGSAGELAEDLRRWLGDQAIKARPPGWRERAGKWGRRHKYLVRSAVAVLGISVVALVVSTWLIAEKERQVRAAYEAERTQRTLAVSNLKRAIDALDRIHLRVISRLPEKAQLSAADRQLMQEALGFYEELARENDFVHARHESLRAQFRVGLIYVQLGIRDKAEAAFRRAIAGDRALLAEFPDDADYQQNLVVALCQLGCLLNEAGRTAEAEPVFREFQTTAERLSGFDPARLEYQRYLAESFRRWGQVLGQSGRSPEAETAFRRALAIAQELARREPPAPEDKHGQSLIINDFGVMRWQQQRLPEAAEFYRQGLAIADKLVNDDSTNPLYRETCARFCHNLVVVQPGLDHRKENEQLARKSLELTKQLAAEFPGVPDYQMSVVETQNNLAIMLAPSQPKQAEALFREAVATQEMLVKQSPGVAHWKSSLGNSLNNLALMVYGNKDVAEACRLEERATEQLKAVAELLPRDANNLFRLQGGYATVAEWYRELGDMPASIQANARASAICRTLVAEFKDLAAYKTALAGITHNQAEVCYERGDVTEALKLLDEAIRLEELAFAAGNPSAMCREFLRNHYSTLSYYLSNGPDVKQRDPARAVEMAKKAVDLDPKFGEAHMHLGMAKYRAGDFSSANWSFTKALFQRAGDDGRTAFFLAMVKHQQGNKKDAEKFYRIAAQKLDPKKPAHVDLPRLKTEVAELLRIN